MHKTGLTVQLHLKMAIRMQVCYQTWVLNDDFSVGIFAAGAKVSGMVSCLLFFASSSSLGFQVAGPRWKLGGIFEEG